MLITPYEPCYEVRYTLTIGFGCRFFPKHIAAMEDGYSKVEAFVIEETKKDLFKYAHIYEWFWEGGRLKREHIAAMNGEGQITNL